MDDSPYNKVEKEEKEEEEEYPSEQEIKDNSISNNDENKNSNDDENKNSNNEEKPPETDFSESQPTENDIPPPPIVDPLIDKPNIEDGDKLYIQPPVTPIVVHNYNNDDFVPGGERIRRAEEECCCRCCTCTNCCTDEDCQNCLDCIEAFCQALMYILYCLVLVGQCLAAFSGN